MRGSLSLLAVVLPLVCFTQHAASQEGRYELGRRLRRFEVAWQSADSAGRARSTAAMETAVSRFFGLRWLDAAQQLDAAYLAVQGEPQSQAEQKRWALAQRMSVRPMFADVDEKTLQVELRSFYPVERCACRRSDAPPAAEPTRAARRLRTRGECIRTAALENGAIVLGRSQRWLAMVRWPAA